ncbi:MAG: hypothetical protein KDC88_06565 [Ignavibacteriae bacterium]|nr:hypothetical protein [Ignavibacteriota bacterium]MCB9219399.1 hypothetical protein [Ignavibacteriales bacterium]MCB9259923.1 hypothetical protein [Ignavibacteriales bacterium]
MIFTPKYIRKSSRLFLIVFLTFLGLSFSHAHKINFVTDSPLEFGIEKHVFSDPLLDSSLNCTIQTFNNSITFSNVFELTNTKIHSSDEISFYHYIYHSNNSLVCTQLRAPPIS